MRKIIPLILVVIALAALVVRVQPRGTASVFRNGDRIIARMSSVYVRPFSGSRCRVAMIGEQLSLDTTAVGSSATRDEYPVRIRFTYNPPQSLPPAWPAGDWCTSLRTRVADITRHASAQLTVTQLLDQRRAAGDRVAAAIVEELRGRGVRVSGVSARIELPAGFDRLRPVSDIAARARAARPVIFIGLDGADWQLLDDYVASGAMPNLKRLVSTGAAGVLETEHPPLSPLLWTTMMTGVSPLQHAILDFTRFNPHTQQKEPITSGGVWVMGNLCRGTGARGQRFGSPLHVSLLGCRAAGGRRVSAIAPIVGGSTGGPG
jgi:hypothetical protein